MKKLLLTPFVLTSLLALFALMMAYGQPTTADASASTTSHTNTSSSYKVNSCTTYDIGVHSQALPSAKYDNPAYGFSMFYNGDHVSRPWVVSQDAKGVHFDPKGSTNGEDLTIRLDNSKSETPEAFLRRLIGPVARQQKCKAQNITFGSFNGNTNINWTSIAVQVTIKATNTQTKQLYMVAKNPKTGKMMAAIFTNDPGVSANTNREDLRYMMDTFVFI